MQLGAGSKVRTVAVPGFLLLCLLLGGSSQSIWPSSILYLLGFLLIGWAVVTPGREPFGRPARTLAAIVIATLVLVLVQLIPLPPGLWRALPGREVVQAGYATLGIKAPWLPLSLAPYQTLESAYALLPPIAVGSAFLAIRGQSDRAVAGAIMLGALASVLLAALQVGSSGPPAWPYLYELTSLGAVGFFANRNHMATLLLAAIPFAAALFASANPQVRQRTAAFTMLAVAAAGFVLIIAGLALNRSLAAALLAIPVTGFSLLILPVGWRFRRLVGPLAALAFLVSVGALANSSIRNELAGSPEIGSLYSRGHIWEVTLHSAANAFPAGTGLGTFRSVYALTENPAVIDQNSVNHAHNDYVELLLETGLPGLVLMLAFLVWYGLQSIRVWRSPFSSLFAKAASIASGAILAHSIVDYPLRTSAIAALFAACLVIMVEASRQSGSHEAKHVRIA